jgi:hypothetical protein
MLYPIFDILVKELIFIALILADDFAIRKDEIVPMTTPN